MPEQELVSILATQLFKDDGKTFQKDVVYHGISIDKAKFYIFNGFAVAAEGQEINGLAEMSRPQDETKRIVNKSDIKLQVDDVTVGIDGESVEVE